MPYLRDLGVSHLYLPPSFQARRGLRRTATTWSTRRASPTSSAASASSTRWRPPRARRARADPRHRARTTWRPTTPTATGPTRRCGRGSSTSTRRPAATAASSTSTTWPPSARRTSTSSPRRTSWRCGWRARGRSTGCASTTPTGSPTRPATCGGCATAAREHVWVEKILDPGERLRDWAVEGTVGYEFLNDVAALFVDPAGEAPLTDLWVELVGRRPAVRRGRVRGQARAGARPVRARGRPAAARGAARGRRARAHARLAARLPHLRRAVVGRASRTPTARRSARPGSRSRSQRVLLLARARLGRVRHALPADHAADHGQGRRGHGLLPLRAAAGAERRRRRPEPLRHLGRGLPRRATPSARRASRATCWSRRRTTPSARATCGRGSARWPAMAEEWAARVRRWLERRRSLRRGGARTRVERYFIFQTLVGRWPIEPERLEAYMEKALREAKRNTNWIEPDDGVRGARAGASAARCTSTGRSCATSSRSPPRSPRAGDRAALGQLLLKLTVPGVPDIYQGDELLRALAGRPRQPPPGRLGAPPRAARRGPRAAPRPTARRASCG